MATKIDNRSQLIYALTEVSELEHMLMCQYLFAAASLKSLPSEYTHPTRKYHQLELVRSWKIALLTVAREEMQHLTYATNLLISVGGSPTFQHPNFPNNNRFYKHAGEAKTMSLDRFSLKAIRRFIDFEAPPPLKPEIVEVAFIPKPNVYETLHEFYNAIKDAFKPDMFIALDDEHDPIDEDGQRITLRYRKNILNVAKTVEEAKAMVDLIIEEGEGSSSSDPNAHVNIFKRIEAEYKKELVEDPAFDPSRPVLSNTMTRIQDDIDSSLLNEVTCIDPDLNDGLPYNLLQLFGGAYEILLIWLFQVFNQHGTEKEVRAIETLAFFPYMTEVIRPIMEILTRYPVKVGDKKGALGAGFEVTSNDFMIPRPEAAHKLTIERLADLSKLAQRCAEQLGAQGLFDLKQTLNFVVKTIGILNEEFASRVLIGWKPDPGDPDEYSEDVGRLWVREMPNLLQLSFEGWAQCRLGTDPDGANEKRGVTGNTFAIGDEPDLDRIIRFQPEKAVVRPHCPAIGITVRDARIVLTEDRMDRIGKEYPEFIGAKVDLLDDPKFEGRNHMVSEDGEPIDPFTISVRLGDGSELRRSVIANGRINELSPLDRRKTFRFPVSLTLGVAAMTENLNQMGRYAPRCNF